MKSVDRQDYITYRLVRSKETMEVVELLIENNRWNSAVNRLYYAAFYAISALLVISEIETKSHSGLKTKFFLHYIRSGKIDPNLGKAFSDLFDWRFKGDYSDFVEFTEEDVMSILPDIKELINSIGREIEKEGF